MNSFKDFIEKAASNVSKAASDAASIAGDVISKAPGTIGEAASTATDTVSSVASAAADAVGSAVEAAPEPIRAAASSAADAVGNAASAAADTIGKGVEFIQENSPAAYLKRARINGFKNGINQGAYLVAQQRWNYYYAYVATLCFFLRSDGEFSEEEEGWLKDGLSHLKLEGGLPDEVKDKLFEIAGNEQISFDDVASFLDDVSLVSLESIVDSTEVAIKIDGVIDEGELRAREQLQDYITSRTSDDGACQEDWAKIAIEESVAEYSENYDKVNEEFKTATKLQDHDIAFLMGATALQVARVLVINALTEVEAAGKDNRNETALHNFQEKLFGQDKFKEVAENEQQSPSRLYASTSQIISTPGVPYDVTNGGKLNELFIGGNHRFATLGHDPVLGLIFGTSNIMTNTITTVKGLGFMGLGIGIPTTYPVEYSASLGSPRISSIQAGTIAMLSASAKRVSSDPVAAAASLIKQVIHIGTDLYTPLGIQLPLANIVLDNTHAQKLTEYISTGDILKVGAQAGMTVLINWLVAALHGSSLIFKDDGEEFSLETYQARTKKIILISNTIATSSSVVQAAITKNPKCLDLGGAAVLIYRMFTDLRFIAKVKEDYVNSKLNDIYAERAKGILQ